MTFQGITGGVTLLPGLFQERGALVHRYMMELSSDGLVQNFETEASVRRGPLFHKDTDYDKWFWGWESPTSEVRGQFLGCWMTAAARMSQTLGDPVLLHKLTSVIERLEKCQQHNGGEWLGSFPEKYMYWLAAGTPPWVPHYVVHKTLLGLRESYVFGGSAAALELEKRFVAWLERWFGGLDASTRAQVLDVETGGMLEELAQLYEITRDPRHLALARLYSRETLFQPLLDGEDPLTNRHANTTIAEVLGAAAMFDVTGEPRWREITEAYWKCAVTDRGTFATGGQNCGEIWCPPHEFAARLGERNQEHCTVYHMIRLAEYFLRWTGDAIYADYIEKNLYNGILASQNRSTGMIAYYVPLAAGLKKKWGHPTRDFWCCHGTLVLAHAYVPSLIYGVTDTGLAVTQYIPSRLDVERNGARIQIHQDWDITRGGTPIDAASNAGDRHRPKEWRIAFDITCEPVAEWTLSLRIPAWISGQTMLRENGTDTPITPNEHGFFEIRRTWSNNRFVLVLPRAITVSNIPDEPDTVAFLDGPVVLAAVTEDERQINIDPARPGDFLVPENEREWGNWQDTFRLKGQPRGLRFRPLYDITDEPYAVYFPVCQRDDGSKKCDC